jgi:hypothetical protein
MSDLQCPARLYVGWPAEDERPAGASWEAHWPALAGERVVATYDRRGTRADLDALADVHRGEAVLVVVSSEAVPGLGPGDLVGLSVDGDGTTRLPLAGSPPSEPRG